jgi:hypothetical protein
MALVRSRSPNLTPLEFFLWGALKNTAYTSKPHTLQELRREIEIACAAFKVCVFLLDTLYIISVFFYASRCFLVHYRSCYVKCLPVLSSGFILSPVSSRHTLMPHDLGWCSLADALYSIAKRINWHSPLASLPPSSVKMYSKFTLISCYGSCNTHVTLVFCSVHV